MRVAIIGNGNLDAAHRVIADAAHKASERTSTTNDSAMDAICGQKLSCRFQNFVDKIRCGAPAVIDCRHKQHQ
jgi:hypothetical protein